MTESPPSLRRGLILYGTSFVLVMATSLLFMAFKPPGAPFDIPTLSLVVSLGAVLAPALVACFWPRTRAPGLPPFRRVNPLLLLGVALASLPLYMGFAALQMRLGKWLALKPPSGLVAPLTAGTPLHFLWIWLTIAVLPALSEEFLYRGVLQRALVGKLGPLRGLFLAACLFSLAHMEPVGAASRVLMGVWFGFLLLSTGSLWADALAHALNNTWGVVLANWHGPILSHLPLVYGAGALAGVGALACFYAAGLFRRPQNADGVGPLTARLSGMIERTDGPSA